MLIPVLILIFIIIVINVLQNKTPLWLPIFLRTWNFLPLPFRSLEPYDKIITSCKRNKRILSAKVKPIDHESQSSVQMEYFGKDKVQAPRSPNKKEEIFYKV